MNLRIISIMMVVIVLVSCGSESAPAEIPTKPAATMAPVESSTPIPSPTPVPTPTATTRAPPELKPDAELTLLSSAGFLFRSADFQGALTIYSSMLEYDLNSQLEALVRSLRADCYIKLGEFQKAIDDLLAAVELGQEKASVTNNLCWYNGILGQAEAALEYCEQTVLNEPSAQYMDSRGMVYAQLGELESAISDFQAVVDELATATDPSLVEIYQTRQSWLATLQSGSNPFTQDVLAELQAAEIQDSLPLFDDRAFGNRTWEAFLASAEGEGFAFGDTQSDNGRETVIGMLSDSGCSVELTVAGDGTVIKEASMQLTGCTPDVKQGMASWFMGQWIEEYEDVIHVLFVWMVTDLYYIFESDMEESAAAQYGDVYFTVATIPGSDSGIEITAELK